MDIERPMYDTTFNGSLSICMEKCIHIINLLLQSCSASSANTASVIQKVANTPPY